MFIGMIVKLTPMFITSVVILCLKNWDHHTQKMLNDWIFVYKISDCGFKSRRSHLNINIIIARPADSGETFLLQPLTVVFTNVFINPSSKFAICMDWSRYIVNAEPNNMGWLLKPFTGRSNCEYPCSNEPL